MRAFALAGLMVALASSPATAETVARVVDGDTLVMSNGERIRLRTIDAPELTGICRTERENARRARDLVIGLVMGQEVTVFRHGRDLYRRTLADVILPDGRDLGGALLMAGLAVPWSVARRWRPFDWCT